MQIPEWAWEVISLHSIFEEAGIEVDVRWDDKNDRVESACHDIPPFIFPARSWYVSKEMWDSGLVLPNLHTQLRYLQEYLNEH